MSDAISNSLSLLGTLGQKRTRRYLLENVQIRAVKMISGLKGKTYQEKLRELNLMSLEERRTRFDMIKVFKTIHGIDMVEKDK